MDDPALRRAVDNMWRHFWHRCMREVGAVSRLPVEPIAADFDAYDMEKNEFFRRRAGEWRAARRHNRIRVRLKQ